MTLQEILKFAKAHKACKSQYSKFKSFIKSGDELQAWQTVLGNIEWLQGKRLDIDLLDVIQITNIAKTWYKNGQLFECYTYNTEGEIDGLYESWHSNRQLYMRLTYKNDYPEGLYESWHDNGQLLERYTYNTEGKIDGLFESWDDKGQVEERLLFKNGELIEESK